MDATTLENTLSRARRQDPAALTALFDAYGGRVFGLLQRMVRSRETAEDLLQETFLRVVRTIESYEHDGRFEAWLFRIAANLARDHGRKQQRRGTPATLDGGDDEGTIDVAAAEAPAWAGLQQAEEVAELEAALQRLPGAEREVLLLRHFGELPFKEIAALLGVPLGTALARAHRGLKRLKSELSATVDH